MKVFEFDRLASEHVPEAIHIRSDDVVEIQVAGLGQKRWTIAGIFGEGECYSVAVADGGQVLLAGETSSVLRRLAWVDGDEVEALPLARLPSDDIDYFHQSFVLIDGGVLFVYEHGIVCFDSELRVLWSDHHRLLDRHFLGIERGLALYESEYEGQWGYDLETGAIKPWPTGLRLPD